MKRLTVRSLLRGRILAARVGWSLLLVASLASAESPESVDCDSADVHSSRSTWPERFSVAAVGDMIIQQPALEIIKARAAEIAGHLSEADIAFGNFESNSFDISSFVGGHRDTANGPVLLAPPEVPRELKRLGFSIVSTANNHAGDWGEAGVLATVRTLNAAGLASAGTGASLREARAPACVMAKGVRAALVAVTSSFDGADVATTVRPGVSALAVSVHDGAYRMDDADRRAVIDAVRQARKRAQFVMVSLHTHQAGADPEQPTEFEVGLAHDVIDSGANLFVAHGPHELRGIEVYKGRAIFYSLGNFAVMQPPPSINPRPLVLPPGSVFTRRAFFESALALSIYRRGRLAEVRLYPFELAATDEPSVHGLPEAVTSAGANAILGRLQALSRRLGTVLDIRDDVAVLHVASP